MLKPPLNTFIIAFAKDKVFCQTFFQKSLQGAECPVDIRLAPTGAKRRPDSVRK